MPFLWTYLIGPVLAFLPHRWREAIGSREVRWNHAGMLSGLLESTAGIVTLGYWYSYGMQRMVNAGLDSALHGRIGPGVTDQEIGGVSFVVMATHPITWVLGFFVVEGAVRLCSAAFAESTVATLPLATVECVIGLFRAKEERAGEALKRNAQSFGAAVKERLLESKAKDVADELSYHRNEEEEYLARDPSEPEEGGVGGSQGGACRWGVLPPGGGRSQEGDTAILVPLEEIDSGGAREECDFL